MNSFNKISKCRISGSSNLKTILNLGNQSLTGVFPKVSNQKITTLIIAHLLTTPKNCSQIFVLSDDKIKKYCGGYQDVINKKSAN